MKHRGKIRPLLFGTLAVCCLGGEIGAQSPSGIVILNLAPGARQQGMAGVAGAGWDDVNSLYANPAATALLREWQWSASYAKWIAEVYQASFFYGQQFRGLPGGSGGIAFGAVQQGVPAFDNTGADESAVAANDLLLFASLAQRFRLGGHVLAVGLNTKNLRSRLAGYQANTWLADFGVLFRSRRFAVVQRPGGWFESGMVMAGFAVSHLGTPLQYEVERTPLPRTFRASLALLAGSREGLQLTLAGDYRRIRYSPAAFALGGELSWGGLLSVQAGYDFASALVSHFTAGLSLAITRRQTPLPQVIPGRSGDWQLAMASSQGNELFDRTYRATVGQKAAGPAAFTVISPADQALIPSARPAFVWRPSADPDPFGNIRYHVVVARDSAQITEAMKRLRLEEEPAAASTTDFGPLVAWGIPETSLQPGVLEPGRYFWAVAAQSADGATRFARREGKEVFSIVIPAPDVEITRFDFDPSPWITSTPEQGYLRLTLKNNGVFAAKNLQITLEDTLLETAALADERALGTTAEPIALFHLDSLAGGETREFITEWRTPWPGEHRLLAQVAHAAWRHEVDAANNRRELVTFTIPKGLVLTADTVTTHVLSTYMYDLPFVAEVFFDSSSAVIKQDYLRLQRFEPSLVKLAMRLRESPQARIRVQGFADPNSGETRPSLARDRAQAVRRALLEMGVRGEQVTVLPPVLWPRRRTPPDPDDARWIMEERRLAKITTDRATQELLFAPNGHEDNSFYDIPVNFIIDFESPAPLTAAWVRLQSASRKDSLDLHRLSAAPLLHTTVGWHAPGGEGGDSLAWIGRNITYALVLRDSLGREFHTSPRTTFLTLDRERFEKKFAWPLKFGQTGPLYEFYWERMFEFTEQLLKAPDVHLRFEGHACAIGPEDVNLRLSQRRARAFRERFLAYIREQHPDAYRNVLTRLDAAVAYGEKHPLHIEHEYCNLSLIMGNESPIERQFNRRIEIVFYKVNTPEESFGKGYALPGVSEE